MWTRSFLWHFREAYTRPTKAPLYCPRSNLRVFVKRKTIFFLSQHFLAWNKGLLEILFGKWPASLHENTLEWPGCGQLGENIAARFVLMENIKKYFSKISYYHRLSSVWKFSLRCFLHERGVGKHIQVCSGWSSITYWLSPALYIFTSFPPRWATTSFHNYFTPSTTFFWL